MSEQTVCAKRKPSAKNTVSNPSASASYLFKCISLHLSDCKPGLMHTTVSPGLDISVLLCEYVLVAFFIFFKEVFSLCCCFSETILQVFNTEGEFLLKFGSNGEGNGQFNAPTGVAVDVNGNIIVADWGNSRIQVRRMNHFYSSKNRLIQTSVSFFFY